MSKWWRLLAWAGLMVVVGLIPLVIGWDHLPDPVATHWGLGGEPDGSMSLAFVPWLHVGIVAVGLLTTSLFRVEGEPSAEAFAMLGMMGGLGLALNVSLVQLNWDVGVWTDAGAFTFWHLAAALLAAFVGGALGFLLGRHWYPVREPGPMRGGPVIHLAAGERVSWVGRATARWSIFMLGGAVIVFLLVPDGGKWVAVLFVVLAVMITRSRQM